MNAISATALTRLNEPTPDFDARTTHGNRKLADYKGKWLILFSHPADFTPKASGAWCSGVRWQWRSLPG